MTGSQKHATFEDFEDHISDGVNFTTALIMRVRKTGLRFVAHGKAKYMGTQDVYFGFVQNPHVGFNFAYYRASDVEDDALENKTVTITMTVRQARFLQDKLANTPCEMAGTREGQILHLLGRRIVICPHCDNTTFKDDKDTHHTVCDVCSKVIENLF